jgi:hypothetical protein
MAPIRATFSDQSKHIALSISERVERIGVAPLVHESRHDRRVDYALALGEPPERVNEDGDVEHAILEQIAHVARRL